MPPIHWSTSRRASPRTLSRVPESASSSGVGAAAPEAVSARVGERMVFPCERRDRGGDVGEGGVEVAAGHAGRGVPGKGLGDWVAGDAPGARDGGVAAHVSRNRDAFVPAEAFPGPGEQPVVVAPGDRFVSAVSEHGIASIVAFAICSMRDHERDEGGRGRLFALGVVLFPKPDGGPGGVDVAASEVEGALASGAGLEVEPDEQQVEARVGPCAPDGVDEVGELPVVEGPSSTCRAERLAERGSGVGGDVSGVDGAGVEGAGGSDAGLSGGPPVESGRWVLARSAAASTTAARSVSMSSARYRSPSRAAARRQ